MTFERLSPIIRSGTYSNPYKYQLNLWSKRRLFKDYILSLVEGILMFVKFSCLFDGDSWFCFVLLGVYRVHNDKRVFSNIPDGE